MLNKPILSRIVRSLLGGQITAIYSPYKVGSTTLFDRLCQPRFCAGGDVKLVSGAPPSVLHFLVKCHSGSVELSDLRTRIDRRIDRIITLVRPVREIYLSAFFQDITNATYPYFFGTKEEILKASIEELAHYFLSIEWESYPHLQTNCNALQIKSYCGVDYSRDFIPEASRSFRVYTGASSDGAVQVAVARTSILSDARQYASFIKALKLPQAVRVQKLSNSTSNVSADKWYAEKYAAVKKHPQVVSYLKVSDEFTCESGAKRWNRS